VKATQIPSRWYSRLTPTERAKLWAMAVDRGDEDDATALLSSCPRVVGSIRDPEFIAAAAAARPDRVGVLVDLVPHSREPFNVTFRILEKTAEENAVLEAFRATKAQGGAQKTIAAS